LQSNLDVLDRTLVRAPSGDRVSARRLLRHPEVRIEAMVATEYVPVEISTVDSMIDVASLETTVKYEGYLRRQEAEVQRARKDERRRIPPDFPYDRVPGLSREVVQRLSQVRPDTLGHALRIPGVTPAAVAVLGSYVGRIPPT
jgi:tRNA uridine 5-carboxymethylaminomethyl modification enzyme